MIANDHQIDQHISALNEATEEVVQQDLAQSRAIAEFLKTNPRGGSQENLEKLIVSLPVNPAVQEAREYLTLQGLIILCRGQAQDTRLTVGGLGLLSPVARSLPPLNPDLLPELSGLPRSLRLYDQVRKGAYVDSSGKKVGKRGNFSRKELARYTQLWHDHSLPPQLRPPIHTEIPGSLVDSRIGGLGIPTTRLPGIAANPEWRGHDARGVIYVIRYLRSQVTLASGSLLDLEQEYVIFNQIPDQNIYRLLLLPEYPLGLRIDENTPHIILA